jgi:hypothetical protein
MRATEATIHAGTPSRSPKPASSHTTTGTPIRNARESTRSGEAGRAGGAGKTRREANQPTTTANNAAGAACTRKSVAPTSSSPVTIKLVSACEHGNWHKHPETLVRKHA